MNRHMVLVILVGALLPNLSGRWLPGQTPKDDLEPGLTKVVQITQAAKHQYRLKLEKDQIAFLRVEQKGVDLKVRTVDPAGKLIKEFDSPNGKQGPELVVLHSESAGMYVIDIVPFDANERAGEYEVCLEHLRSVPVTNDEKVDAIFLPWDNDANPGAAVAVVRDGEIVYSKGYGIANLEYQIPITPSSVFHIASVSKQFTVFSILLLEQAGKLSLDDDIRKHIPEVPDFGTTITLRHLASHTSGLRDQWALLAMAGWRTDDVITKEHILKLVARQKTLNFIPGDEYAYCNTGFTLLAEVVARVSGKTFAQFTAKNIFEPLQMSQTLFYDDHEAIVTNRAYSYYNRGKLRKSNLNFANVGATSLFTTSEDLARWAINFGSPKVGSTDIFEKMSTLAVLNNGKTFGGALGQFTGKYKGVNEIQHSGGDAGYRSFLTRFPDQGIAVIVLSNSAEFNPVATARRVADIYLENELVPEPRNPTSESSASAETGHPKPFDSSSVDLSGFTGRFYSDELTTEYRFVVVDDTLVARHRRLSDRRLRPNKPDGFAGFFGDVEFVRDSGNSVTGFNVSNGRVRNVWFEKRK